MMLNYLHIIIKHSIGSDGERIIHGYANFW